MTTPTDNCLFLGKPKGKLDDRKRMTLPSNWREQIRKGGRYLAMFDYSLGNIRVYPPSIAEKIIAASERLFIGEPDASAALDRLLGTSADVKADTFDTAGRILFPDELLELANITNEVRFNGSGRTFTIASDNPPTVDRDSPEVKSFLETIRRIFPTNDESAFLAGMRAEMTEEKRCGLRIGMQFQKLLETANQPAQIQAASNVI